MKPPLLSFVPRRALYRLALLLAVAGCQRPAHDTTKQDRGANAHADDATDTIHIDAALLASGRVEVESVVRRRPRGELRLPAEVRPDRDGQAEVGALVAGRVASIEVSEGERVRRGQVLARVDAPEAVRTVAELLRARARLGAAERALERQTALEKERATSASAVDEARAGLRSVRAELAAARTLLHSLGVAEPSVDQQGAAADARVPLRSPIDGVVAERRAVLGGPVTPEALLFRVVSPSRVTLLARLPESAKVVPARDSEAVVLSRGQTTSGEPPCRARLVGDVGAVDPATRTLALRLQPIEARPDVCERLRPGAYVDVVFLHAPTDDDRSAVLTVSREAVVELRGEQVVFVAEDAAGSFRVRPVQVLDEGGGDLVIEAGLRGGERVATAGALLLKGEALRDELGEH